MSTDRTGPGITAAVLHDQALNPALDAIAVNDTARAQWHRPETPELDSAFELFEALGEKLVMLARLNGVEGHYERQLAGWADRMAQDLRGIELNARSRPLTARDIAEALIAPLDVLGDALSLDRAGEARRELHAIFDRVPRDVLWRREVLHHIGERRARTLDIEHENYRRRLKARAR